MQNTSGKLLSTKQNPSQNKSDKSSVRKLTFPDCNMRYIGQMGGPFHARYQEHFLDNKYANNKSKFAQHLLDT